MSIVWETQIKTILRYCFHPFVWQKFQKFTNTLCWQDCREIATYTLLVEVWSGNLQESQSGNTYKNFYCINRRLESCSPWAAVWFWIAHEIKMIFTFLNGETKINRRIIFYNTWMWYEIHISVSLNEVSLEHSHACLFIYFLRLLSHNCRSEIEIETIWPERPKMFNIWFFT